MVRINFHDELETTRKGLLAEANLVSRQLRRVLEALDRRDAELAAEVIADDDRVDDIYLATETRIQTLLALQAPVARDLRLVMAMIHCNMHVERIGDLCVNIAKFVRDGHPYPSGAPMVVRLEEMGARALEMIELSARAFGEEDVDLAEKLPIMDNVLDRLNRGMLEDLEGFAGDADAFEWAANLMLVARYLERMGDHAVDIGEQTSFMVTGVFREFTDASHPEREQL